MPLGGIVILALELLRDLQGHREGAHMIEVAPMLRVDPLQLEEPVAALEALGWLGVLQDGRHVLLVDPAVVSVEPLLEALLLPRNELTGKTWGRTAWAGTVLADLL